MNLTETEWLKSLSPFRNMYDATVTEAAERYVFRVIGAYELSDYMGQRATESLALSIDVEAINGLTEALAGAYMSGMSRANDTLPKWVPRVPNSFSVDDMNSLNSLKSFSADEVRKFGDDLRITMRLRILERNNKREVIEAIKQDLIKCAAKSERLANTEIMRAANRGRINAYIKRNVSKVQWVAQPDSCLACRKLNGVTESIYMLEPLPHHPNCTCTVTAANLEWSEKDAI